MRLREKENETTSNRLNEEQKANKINNAKPLTPDQKVNKANKAKISKANKKS